MVFYDPKLDAHVAEQRTINTRLAEEGESLPAPGTIPPDKLRRARRFNRDGSSRVPVVAEAYDKTIETTLGKIAVRVFPQDNRRGTYLHFHGGGWVLGSIYEQDVVLWKLARNTSMQVISIDYPLAPEHELPLAIAHAEAAAVALLACYDAEPIFCIGGESAGAHIALSTCLQLRDNSRSAFDRVRALNLSYGAYDLGMTPSQRLWGETFIGLSGTYMNWFYTQCLPNRSVEERRAPEFSPLYRNVSGMPAALFNVGTLDPLLDDSLFMAARWQSAGNSTELAVYPEAPHGFNGMRSAMAKACNARIFDFLNSAIADP